MIREDWVEVELNEICDIYTGTGFPKKYQGEKKGKYPFYKVGDISKNVKKGFKVLKLCDNYIEDDIVEKIKGKVLPKDSIVFAKIGEALKLNRRALTTSFCLIDNNVTGVKFKDDGMSPLFLYYIFLLVRLEDYSRATTVPSVRKTDIEKIKLPLVPVPEQRAIVAKIEESFSKLDSGIESLKKAKEQLEIYRQAVLKAAFEGELTKDKEKIIFVKLGNVLNIVSGKTPKGLNDVNNDGKNKFLKVSDMNLPGNEIFMKNSKLNLNDKDIIDLKIKRCPKGTVIFPKTGGAIFTNKKRILIDESSFDLNIMGILPNENYRSKYIYYFFVYQDLRKFCDGTAVPQINKKHILRLQFPSCSVIKQEEIIIEIESRLSVCDNILAIIEGSLEKAEALRQSILKKAFEGKLLSKEELEACRQEDDWEPAAELLKRIQEANKEVN